MQKENTKATLLLKRFLKTRMELHELTLKESLDLLDRKKIPSVDLVSAFLKRIKKYDSELHSFITLRDDEALNEAKRADLERRKGSKKPLLGVAVAIKDNFLTRGIRTTAASPVLDDYIPQYDSRVVSRLKKAGVIIIGKTNLDAWGHGSSGEHTVYGVPHNPYAYGYVTGGSSSGSAAAVAARFCVAATGSDTGGSNRQPGSYCNLVGLKPTYGRVSRYGVIAMASSTDCMGCLTRTIWDSAKILSVISGYDPLDSTSSQKPVGRYEEKLENPYKAKIGIPKEFFTGLDKKVAKVVETSLKILEKKGHTLVHISLPTVPYAYPIYAVVQTSEVSSNLARFDGVRYGFGREKFQDEAKRRIMIGTHSLSSGYADKYYKQAMKGRTLLIKDFYNAFKKVDVIAGPVYPFPPFKHGERETDPLKMYLSDVLTVPANLTGHPAISVPVEFVDNMPNGLQLIAPHFEEARLFRVGYDIEQELPMYKVKPIFEDEKISTHNRN